MRAVVDESVPRKLVLELTALGQDVTAFQRAWKGLKNGLLIEQIRSCGFQILITCDKNFQHQQNIGKSKLGLIVLPSPFMPDLLPGLLAIPKALASIEPGQVIELKLALGS